MTQNRQEDEARADKRNHLLQGIKKEKTDFTNQLVTKH